MSELTTGRARKRPVVIAFRIARELEVIQTLEGAMTANPGDYIITGVAGEVYPCKPDIFLATYEILEDGKTDDWGVATGKMVHLHMADKTTWSDAKLARYKAIRDLYQAGVRSPRLWSDIIAMEF